MVARARTLARARAAARPTGQRCRTKRRSRRNQAVELTGLACWGVGGRLGRAKARPYKSLAPLCFLRWESTENACKSIYWIYGVWDRDWAARAALQSHFDAQAGVRLVRDYFR